MGVVSAQNMEGRLLSGATLDHSNLLGLGAFDTLGFTVGMGMVQVDTSVIHSDRTLLVVISFDRGEAAMTTSYFMSSDRERQKAATLVHLSDNRVLDGSERRYTWTSNSIDANKRLWSIEYRCRVWTRGTKGKVKDVKAWRLGVLTVNKEGDITVGEWESAKGDRKR